MIDFDSVEVVSLGDGGTGVFSALGLLVFCAGAEFLFLSFDETEVLRALFP